MGVVEESRVALNTRFFLRLKELLIDRISMVQADVREFEYSDF